MIAQMAGNKHRIVFKFLMLASLGLAFGAGAWPAAAQQNQPDQPGEVQAPAAPQDSQAQGQPDTPSQQQPDAQPLSLSCGGFGRSRSTSIPTSALPRADARRR